MADFPKTPRTSAEFDTQAAQAFKDALKRLRELLTNTRALVRHPSGLRTETAPMNDRLAELRSLVKRPAVKEHIAAEAAKAAQEADRKGKVELADHLWSFVRRTRVSAMKLRPLVEAHRQGGA
jgi:hypothetical protein